MNAHFLGKLWTEIWAILDIHPTLVETKTGSTREIDLDSPNLRVQGEECALVYFLTVISH